MKDNRVSFTTWLSDSQFPFTERTAYNLMKLAGSGEEEREEKKAKDRERCKLPDNEMSGNFLKWLEQNQIAQRTAYDLMTLAGDTPEQREEKKAKDRERKRNSR